MTKQKKIQKKRTRIFMYEHEIVRAIEACKHTMFPIRNELLVLITYNHALRAGETCWLRWEDVDFTNKTIMIRRQKGGIDAVHPLDSPRELELLEEMYAKKYCWAENIFITKRKTVMDGADFYMLTLSLGQIAGFDFVFTPHMLRHSMGTFLANNDVHMLKIKALLGHSKVSSTELYTHLAANKFIGIKKGSIFA